MNPIKHEIKINAEPKKILEALTTPQGIQGWWSQDSTVGTQIGEEMAMRFNKQGQIVKMDMRIEEIGPKRVKWTCTKNDNPAWVGTEITWDLTDQQVKFSHDGWREGGQLYEMTAQGWQHFLGSFKSYCETGEGQPW